MTGAEFEKQFSRLLDHFHFPAESDRGQVTLDWFKAVEHYHVDALDRGVTEVIRTKEDRFWPPLKTVLDAIKGRMAGMQSVRSKCETCHGSTWVEGWPWWSNGMVYTGMQRCLDCGVPVPQIEVNHHRVPLTRSEYQMWKDGTLNEVRIPTPAKNPGVMEALKSLSPNRGRMARAIEGATDWKAS